MNRCQSLVDSSSKSAVSNHFVRRVDFDFAILRLYFACWAIVSFLLLEYVEDALFEIGVVLVVDFDYFSSCILIERSNVRTKGV